MQAHDRVRAEERRALQEALSASDLGTDEPLLNNWRAFRPLALGREEAWSDWLAFVLRFASDEAVCELLGLGAPPSGSQEIQREVVLPVAEDQGGGNYRADLLIEWESEGVHLEVKTGDRDLAKTWGEARYLRRLHHEREWHHRMLVLPEQVCDFTREARRQGNDVEVKVLTWADVSRVLRAELRRRRGTQSERGVLCAFVGSIDQVLLHRPRLDSDSAAVPSWWPASGASNKEPGGEE